MKKIITVANTKGGAGKSTVATNLAVEFSREGKRVLVVDTDIQGSSMDFRRMRSTADIKVVAIHEPTIDQDLPDFDFDIIIVDAGGEDTDVCTSAIMSADLLLIPTRPSQYDLLAVKNTIERLKMCRWRKSIDARFVLNCVVPNTRIEGDALDALEVYRDVVPVAASSLCSRVAFAESVPCGLGVTEYEPNGKASDEIKALFREVVEILK